MMMNATAFTITGARLYYFGSKIKIDITKVGMNTNINQELKVSILLSFGQHITVHSDDTVNANCTDIVTKDTKNETFIFKDLTISSGKEATA